jgi:hypothetical protein
MEILTTFISVVSLGFVGYRMFVWKEKTITHVMPSNLTMAYLIKEAARLTPSRIILKDRSKI